MTTQLDKKFPIIFDHQQIAFEKLRRAGSVCFSKWRPDLPMQPRTNSLIIGPSGSGKTYLARAVAESFGVECKSLSVAEWILLGCTSHGAERTWNALFDFLLKNHTKWGAVIFLDEIDKLTGTSDWVQHLRMEVFRLLDLGVPPDLTDAHDCAISDATFRAVQTFLKRRTLIIAAGAFQGIWDSRSNQIGGFGGATKADAPSQKQLSQFLPKELVNRFRADVVILEELRTSDYENLLLTASEKMPPHLQERFLNMGATRITEAVLNKQGVRFLEELIADLLAEEEEPTAPKPTKKDSLWRKEPHKTPAPGKGSSTECAF